MTWHPIDSTEHPAPRDGTEILGLCRFVEGPRIRVLSWCADQAEWSAYPWKDGEDELVHRDFVTHWMPLPPLPEG